ncbi:MAG TPA: AMP-binding protein [Thermodesulfobacteriota bacterium]
MLVHDLILDQARRAASRPALTDGETGLTYGELAREVLSVAGDLAAAGVAPGDRVGLLLPNVIEFPVFYYGALAAGAVAVPLNTRLTPHELEYIVRDAGLAALVADPAFWGTVEAIRPALSGLRRLLVRGTDAPTGATPTADARRAPPLSAPREPVNDLAQVLYTSGTTGLPKGAMMRHANVLFNARACERCIGYRADDVTLVAVPLFHVTGLNTQLVAVHAVGGVVSLLAEYKADRFLARLEADRVTAAVAVPTIFTLLLVNPNRPRTDLSALRLVAYGGAPIAPETVRQLDEALGVAQFNLYGLTETSSLTTVLPSADALRKLGSVGLPVPGVRVRVVDDAGRDLPAGEAGELLIAGPNIVAGYLNKPEATAAAIRDGWLLTGDVARLDEEGYVFVVDRKKDMINRAGEKVYCIEVEAVLNAHPAVLESAVVPHPDPIFGEVVKAVCVLRPGASATAEDVIAFCRPRLAHFKLPAVVRFVPELPRNPGGKVLKPRLKEMA